MAQLLIDVPAALVPRVVAAMRATYPSLTAGLTDAEAGRAVIRHLVRSVVAAYEAEQARASAASQVDSAESEAWTGTETIV